MLNDVLGLHIPTVKTDHLPIKTISQFFTCEKDVYYLLYKTTCLQETTSMSFSKWPILAGLTE